MVSEHDSATLASSVFKAIVFAPLVVVGVLILLASWMAILEAWSWLLYKFHQYRARRAIDGAAARNMDSGMAENGMPENGILKSSQTDRQVS